MIEKIFSDVRRNVSVSLLAGSMAVTLGCASLSKVNDKTETGNDVTEYALLINGDHDSVHHEANIARAWGKLEDIGYLEDNIISLTGEDPRKNRSPKHNYSPGTSVSLKEAVSYLQNYLDNNDILLVYTTGHGDRIGEKSYLHLYDGNVGSEEIAVYLNKIPFGRLIFVADQCYSGGLVDKIDDLDRNIIAVSDTDVAHSIQCQPFAIGFWTAVGNNGYDIDGDGTVDVLEAYNEGMRRFKSELDQKFEPKGHFSVRGNCSEKANLKFIEN
ncbi:caspase family protein [Candidatus Woesearchaeota archaeon]|nr:caspase family protein [Candidatus Woesearchaeota archaeon]